MRAGGRAFGFKRTLTGHPNAIARTSAKATPKEGGGATFVITLPVPIADRARTRARNPTPGLRAAISPSACMAARRTHTAPTRLAPTVQAALDDRATAYWIGFR